VTTPYLVYVAHPVGGDIPGNLAKARAWLQRLTRDAAPGVIYLAPWLDQLESGAHDDNDPDQRAAGLRLCEATVRRCDAIVLCGPTISTGMAYEQAAAEGADLDIWRAIELCPGSTVVQRWYGCLTEHGGGIAAIRPDLDRGATAAALAAAGDRIRELTAKVAALSEGNLELAARLTNAYMRPPVDPGITRRTLVDAMADHIRTGGGQ
jgi:hypothetical protein